MPEKPMTAAEIIEQRMLTQSRVNSMWAEAPKLPEWHTSDMGSDTVCDAFVGDGAHLVIRNEQLGHVRLTISDATSLGAFITALYPPEQKP